MASLGNVGTMLSSFAMVKVAPAAVVGSANPLAAGVAVSVQGRISGVVTIGGTPVARVLARLYYRTSGQLIEQALTGPNGEYTFYGLDPTDARAYFVTFHDPATAAPFNFTVTKDHLSAG